MTLDLVLIPNSSDVNTLGLALGAGATLTVQAVHV